VDISINRDHDGKTEEEMMIIIVIIMDTCRLNLSCTSVALASLTWSCIILTGAFYLSDYYNNSKKATPNADFF